MKFFAWILLLLTATNVFAQPAAGPARFLQESRRLQDQQHYVEAKTSAQKAVDGYLPLDEPDSLGEAYVMVWSASTLNGLAFADRIPILEKAAAAFKKAGNRRRQADCLLEMADLQQLTGNHSDAFLSLQIALQLLQSVNYPSLQRVYDLLCLVSIYQAEVDEAVRYGLLAIRYCEKTQDSSLSVCTYYNHLGNAYYNALSYEKSLQYYTRSIDIAQKYKDPGGTVSLSLNIVRLYNAWGKPQSALNFFTSLRARYPDYFKPHPVEVDMIMLNIYDRLNAADSAAGYAASLEKELGRKDLDPYTRSASLYSLVYHHFTFRQYAKAAAFLETYGDIARQMNVPQYLRQTMYWHFALDSAEGKYVSAIRYYQQYKLIGDTTLTQTKNRQIAQYNVLFETEKKDKNILLLQQQSEAQQASLRQEKFIRNVTLGGIALLIVIVALLFNTIRMKQRTNRLLEDQRAEISRKNQTLQQLVNEKEWLVKEIHHRVKNNLHMVVGLLASQAEYLKGREAHDAITDSQHRIQAMSLIHQKLYNTENLSSIDMPHYVHELVDYLESSFGTRGTIRFTLDIEKVSFPLSHSIPVGLILNEAITNAIKYAFPGGRKGHIAISLRPSADPKPAPGFTTDQAPGYRLTISDDGIGIPEDYRHHASLGISLIDGLTTDIRGTSTIAGDNGTVITITFPVAQAMTS